MRALKDLSRFTSVLIIAAFLTGLSGASAHDTRAVGHSVGDGCFVTLDFDSCVSDDMLRTLVPPGKDSLRAAYRVEPLFSLLRTSSHRVRAPPVPLP